MNTLTTRKFILFGNQLINKEHVVRIRCYPSWIIIELVGSIITEEHFASEEEQIKRYDALRRIFGAM